MKSRKIPHSENPIVRIVIIGVFEVIGLVIMAFLLDGLSIDRLSAAVFAVMFIALLNALFWPILSRILLPFAILTGGLLFLLLNGAILMISSELIDGFYVSTIWVAVFASIGITAINVVLSTLFTIDDDGSYYRNVFGKRVNKKGEVVETDVPGVFFLEIDGLSLPVLKKAMEQGYTPTIKKWIEDGSHKLLGWETDLSSQTGASQAGLLHGNNFDMPAFRWYDRKKKEIITSSNPDDVAALENDRSDGKGLLANNGYSRGNLLSGDAPNVMNTASTLKDLDRFHSSDFYAYFSDPYSFSRTLVLFVWDIILERWRFRKQRRKNVQPRLDKSHRNFKYALVRGATTTILRELNIYTLIGDIISGAPSAYATFVGYDEVAHHSGIETHDAFDALHKIDQQFARLERVSQHAPRPYHFVILSDHGQSEGSTFKQRYGISLEELIQELAQTHEVHGVEHADESSSNVGNFLTDILQNIDSRSFSKVIGMFKRQTVDKHLENESLSKKNIEEKQKDKSENNDELPRIIVLASGNLGLVYGSRLDERLTLEDLNKQMPGLLEGLASHEGIGFVMVRSKEHGPVVIGAEGRSYLAEGRVEGKDPLEVFGPNAAQHLIREDSFPNCPDLLVNSFYNPDTNEVAAFEELIGCHGGLGGYQTMPFILYPKRFNVNGEKPLVGATEVHHLMKGWLEEVAG